MGQVSIQGTARARLVNEVRGYREFRIGPTGYRTTVSAVHHDADARLAWIDCDTGVWRLPGALFPWAESVESHALEKLGYLVFPCTVRFAQRADGEFLVEVFPGG